MIRRYFLILLTLISLRSFSQSLGIDSSFFTITDTVNFSTVANLAAHVRIKSTDTVPVMDTVRIRAASDSGGGMSIPYKIFYTSASIPVNFQLFGDTVGHTLNDTVTPIAFRSGINTVVIWPVANDSVTNPTSDSLFVTVLVDTTGIGFPEPKKVNGFIMFPNPAHDALWFKTFTTEHPYRKIRIYDLEGRLVMETEFLNRVDVGHLRKGAYIVAVIAENREEIRIKFIRN